LSDLVSKLQGCKFNQEHPLLISQLLDAIFAKYYGTVTQNNNSHNLEHWDNLTAISSRQTIRKERCTRLLESFLNIPGVRCNRVERVYNNLSQTSQVWLQKRDEEDFFLQLTKAITSSHETIVNKIGYYISLFSHFEQLVRTSEEVSNKIMRLLVDHNQITQKNLKEQFFPKVAGKPINGELFKAVENWLKDQLKPVVSDEEPSGIIGLAAPLWSSFLDFKSAIDRLLEENLEENSLSFKLDIQFSPQQASDWLQWFAGKASNFAFISFTVATKVQKSGKLDFVNIALEAVPHILQLITEKKVAPTMNLEYLEQEITPIANKTLLKLWDDFVTMQRNMISLISQELSECQSKLKDLSKTKLLLEQIRENVQLMKNYPEDWTLEVTTVDLAEKLDRSQILRRICCIRPIKEEKEEESPFRFFSSMYSQWVACKEEMDKMVTVQDEFY
jgi:hypothetical protein